MFMKMADIRPLLGQKICWFRKQAGLSQRALADALKVDKATIWRAENGDSWPDYGTLEAIAAQVNVPIEEFFDWKTEETLSFERALDLLPRILDVIRSKLSGPFGTLFRMAATADEAKVDDLIPVADVMLFRDGKASISGIPAKKTANRS